MDAQSPKGWMFTLGLAVLAAVAALFAKAAPAPAPDVTASIEADSCFRYGRFECCIKDE